MLAAAATAADRAARFIPLNLAPMAWNEALRLYFQGRCDDIAQM
jgi:hypothetical protein